jgi:hypothetical protein
VIAPIMSRATNRFSRPSGPRSLTASCFPLDNRTNFYREEFLKHQRCLDRQREYFSEQAIHSVESALQLILSRLDTLCRHQDCDRVLSGLLRKLDLVTRLSAWDDHGRAH